jgi:ABC-type dipeptide/oligopeptide/nickel transport system permease component
MAYVLRRGSVALLVLSLAVVLNFAIVRAAPGNYADFVIATKASLGQGAAPLDPQQRLALTRSFGLDQSIPIQFKDYLEQLVLHRNLGVSFVDHQPVASEVLRAAKSTLPMLLLGTMGGIVLGIGAGVLAASYQRRWPDWVITTLATGLYSLPTQWVGVVLLLLFAGALPVGGQSNVFLLNPSFTTHLFDVLKHMILPCATLSLVTFGGYALIVRSAMLEAMGEDYVQTARAKGFGPRRIVLREVFRNALLPTVTLAALSLGSVFGGAILIEVVFSWPGLGFLARNAIETRDYPVVEGAFLLFTLAIVVFNFIADITYASLDPRVRT